MTGRPPISTYDRRRLLDPDTEPPRLKSLRDATWEHQAYALQLGYRSVMEFAVDKLIEEVVELQNRVEALEEGQ